MSCQCDPFLADPGAWRALSLAIDRDGIAKAVPSYPDGAGQLFPPTVGERLALLRLLLLEPTFIFAGVPTSRLDPITQRQVIALLTETADLDGCAIVLVSHDAALVSRTADRVLSLNSTRKNATERRNHEVRVLP